MDLNTFLITDHDYNNNIIILGQMKLPPLSSI
jgi:hypothetical protein